MIKSKRDVEIIINSIKYTCQPFIYSKDGVKTTISYNRSLSVFNKSIQNGNLSSGSIMSENMVMETIWNDRKYIN